MAKDKFFELPKEKQEQLLKAAKEEFSTKTYEEASINKIIKSIFFFITSRPYYNIITKKRIFCIINEQNIFV